MSFMLAHVFIVKIPELSNDSVLMRDPQKVQEILQCMVKAGHNTLQVIQEKLLNHAKASITFVICIYITFSAGDL